MNYNLSSKLLPLFLLFGLTFQTSSFGNFYCFNLTFDNAADVSVEIIDYYKNTYGGNDLPNFTLSLQQLFLDLNLPAVDNASCRKGHLIRSGYEVNQTGNFSYETRMNLRWDESATTTSAEGYYNGFLDLETLERWDTTLSEPGAIFRIPGTTEWKLLVLNTRCGTTQSGYIIIIVDRDLNLMGLPSQNQNKCGSGHGNSEIGLRLGLDKSKNHLQISPNPVSDAVVQVFFNLSKDQNASLYLVDGSTGRLVQNIISDQPLREGEHVQQITTESLKAGIYYVVLQSESKRLVEKLVKISL